MNDASVLIAGAGPTGLVLALWLTHAGVKVRIVDAAERAGTTSRALAVHARTLELYDQIDLGAAVQALGVPFTGGNLWVGGKRVAHLPLGDIGRGMSPYPVVLILPQDAHEAFLEAELGRKGVRVERQTRLLAFNAREHGVTVRLQAGSALEETVEVAYLAGCDGAHSTVRQQLGAGFPGGTYSHLFYVADVVGTGVVFNGELHASIDEADFLAVFPMQGAGRARLVGQVKAVPAGARAPGWEDVSSRVIDELRLDVREVNWFSTYHVHHRVASHFRSGRVFLLGDAAHVHSPLGGQGMNTGIGDAVNLAWKLAAVLQGQATEALLESYEPERMAFARTLVASTDRGFTFVSSTGPLARSVRVHLIPRVMPRMLQMNLARRAMFRTLSQIGIQYRDSPLSQGALGRVHAGDRLPWLEHADGAAGPSNFAGSGATGWRTQVYGEAQASLRERCQRLGVALQEWPWTPAAASAGFRRNALYLVRPDGYLGLVDGGPAAAESLEHYVLAQGLRPDAVAPA